MTVEAANIQSVKKYDSNNGGTRATFNTADYNLQRNSVFIEAKNQTGSTEKPAADNNKSEESLLSSFKNFLKWNLTGGIIGSLVRGEIGDVIDDFKKETGLSDADLALSTISPAYGAFKIAANAFKDDANEIYNSENSEEDGFGEVSTNLDFES